MLPRRPSRLRPEQGLHCEQVEPGRLLAQYPAARDCGSIGQCVGAREPRRDSGVPLVGGLRITQPAGAEVVHRQGPPQLVRECCVRARPGAPLGRGQPLGNGSVTERPPGVALGELRVLRVAEPAATELPYGLQKAITRLGAWPFETQQAVLAQHADTCRDGAGQYLLRRRRGERLGEDTHLSEHLAFGPGQQVVAPPDRLLQRSVPSVHPRPAAQRVELLAQ